MQIKELTTLPEMLAQLETMQFLYPKMTLEKYESFLKEMIPNHYKQIAIFEDGVCLGLTGFWINTKLWTGKYIEIDNFIVNPNYRSKGIGKMISEYIDAKATELDCTAIVLDAFTINFPAHRFYYNLGYVPKGFHFVKIINEDGIN